MQRQRALPRTKHAAVRWRFEVEVASQTEPRGAVHAQMCCAHLALQAADPLQRSLCIQAQRGSCRALAHLVLLLEVGLSQLLGPVVEVLFGVLEDLVA